MVVELVRSRWIEHPVHRKRVPGVIAAEAAASLLYSIRRAR